MFEALECCCCSVTQLCSTFCDPMECSTPGFPVLHRLPEFPLVHVHCISDTIQPSHPLPPSSPSALNLSQHRGIFQWVGCSHQMIKTLEWRLEWRFNVSPSNQYSGLISLKIDWFDLLVIQRTFRGLLQHHSSKASNLWHSPILQSRSHNLMWP